MNTENETKNKDDMDFHGAAIVSNAGKEMPITEDMVQDACHKLDDDDDKTADNA